MVKLGMRTALYEAAHSLLISSTKWSALRAWGMNIAKRRVPVSRLPARLAVTLHRMWVDGSEYRWSKQAAASAVAAQQTFQFPPDEGPVVLC
jgi:transposase